MPRHEEGFFTAKDTTRLYWQTLLPDGEFTGVVAVVHGYGDHSGRYRHVMEYLVSQGFGTIAMDYRGHGKADGARADVKVWSDYLDDMELFWARARTLAGGKPTWVLAHSHGALMATHWVLGRPEGLKGLVLSAPFYKLAFEPPAYLLLVAKLVKGLMPGLKMSNELKPEQLSRDAAWQKQTSEDPLYLHNTTPRWFFEVGAAQQALTGRGKDFVAPTLYLAGGDDPIAAMPSAKAFFDTIASADKTWKDYQGFKHEVMNDVGKEQVLDDIARWILAHR